MTGNEAFECNAPDVVFENFGDEVILLNLQSGRYYSLDPIGMYFWEYLTQTVPPSEIGAQIQSAYDGRLSGVELSAHLEALLTEFQTEQLIRPATSSRSAADAEVPKTKLPANYAPPALAKFDDVAEMLLLDPVHDVGDAGWPHPAPPKAGEPADSGPRA